MKIQKNKNTVKVYIRGDDRYTLDLYFTKSCNIFENKTLVEVPIELIDEYREITEKFDDMQEKLRSYYPKDVDI